VSTSPELLGSACGFLCCLCLVHVIRPLGGLAPFAIGTRECFAESQRKKACVCVWVGSRSCVLRCVLSKNKNPTFRMWGTTQMHLSSLWNSLQNWSAEQTRVA